MLSPPHTICLCFCVLFFINIYVYIFYEYPSLLVGEILIWIINGTKTFSLQELMKLLWTQAIENFLHNNLFILCIYFDHYYFFVWFCFVFFLLFYFIILFCIFIFTWQKINLYQIRFSWNSQNLLLFISLDKKPLKYDLKCDSNFLINSTFEWVTNEAEIY